MIFKTAKFLWRLPRRLGRVRRLIWDDNQNRTYYPESPRKSKFRILVDLLWLLLRRQEVEVHYYFYGLDRAGGEKLSAYFTNNEFRKVRDRFNARRIGLSTRKDSTGRSADGSILLRHKLVFSQYLKGLGIPTPEVEACGFGNSLYWFDSGRITGLDELQRRDLDVFLKDNQVDMGQRVFPLSSRAGRVELAGEQVQPEDIRRQTGIGQDFMLQRRVKQHPAVAEIHPSSVNTIRMATVATPNGPKVLRASLRVGAGGDHRDNWSTGGLVIGIDLEAGTLMRYGLYAPKFGNRTDQHPDSGVRFLGRSMPFLTEAMEMACLLHRFMWGIGTIGWDIAITPDGPSFIEGNDEYAAQTVQGPAGGMREEFMALVRTWEAPSQKGGAA